MSEWLDTVEQDLKYAYENGDRVAQTRLFVHHVPQMLKKLRALEPVVEVEEVVEEATEGDGSPSVSDAEGEGVMELELPENEVELDDLVEAGEIG